MSQAKIFLTIGIWVIILPYLGFPIMIKNILFVITGLLIIYFSYQLYLKSRSQKKEEKTFDNFSENANFTKVEQ